MTVEEMSYNSTNRYGPGGGGGGGDWDVLGVSGCRLRFVDPE